MPSNEKIKILKLKCFGLIERSNRNLLGFEHVFLNSKHTFLSFDCEKLLSWLVVVNERVL